MPTLRLFRTNHVASILNGVFAFNRRYRDKRYNYPNAGHVIAMFFPKRMLGTHLTIGTHSKVELLVTYICAHPVRSMCGWDAGLFYSTLALSHTEPYIKYSGCISQVQSLKSGSAYTVVHDLGSWWPVACGVHL